MWYFSWILGTALACCLAIMNAVWLELDIQNEEASSTHHLEVRNDERSP